MYMYMISFNKISVIKRMTLSNKYIHVMHCTMTMHTLSIYYYIEYELTLSIFPFLLLLILSTINLN